MRVAMMTREYPPEVYGGAGVHVTELVAQLSRLCAVDVHCMGVPRPGVTAHQPDPRLQDANAALSTVSADLMMANAASVFTMPAGSDEIDTALSANGGATATATGSPNSATAANVLDRSYATAWTPGAGTALALSLTPARSRTGTFPTFHRVLLDEGGFTAVAATPGASGGYGRGTHPIAQYEVRTYLLNSPFYNVIATGTGVGPQRMLDVGPQANVARVEVVVSSTLPITLNEVHLLN
jgi:hypothetical protein